MQKKEIDVFISLVRLGIGHNNIDPICAPDWISIRRIAYQQGLLAVVLDGIERLPNYQRPPQELLLEWIGEVIQSYEYTYEHYYKTISEMARFFNAHGFKMMVLKGYACSLDWPKPEHRPCGDIDIWQFGKQKEADALLKSEKGIKVDKSHHHHTVFEWNDFMVENHFDFINVYHHKSNVEFEMILKDLANDSHFVDICGDRVYLPSPNFHALFLLKHAMIHFASEGITLRQLLDWGCFVKAHGSEINWRWLKDVLDKYGMTELYNIFNVICVEDLGFESSIFHQVQFNPYTKDKVLMDILNPEYGSDLPKNFFFRVIYKYRRWRGSTWKHQLCYKESLLGAFWSGIWNHLVKPSSI